MPDIETSVPLLASLEQLKTRMNYKPANGEADDVDDQLLTDLLEAASDRIARMSGRQFTPTPVDDEDDPIERTYSAFRSKFCRVRDLRNFEVITADGVDVSDSVRLVRVGDDDPAHGLRLPYRANVVTVTGYFGFATVPPSIRDATLGWAQRAYYETRARMADSVIDPEGGIQNYFRTVPPFVSAPVNDFTIAGL